MSSTFLSPEARELQSRMSEFARYNAALPSAEHSLTTDDQEMLLRASPVVDANRIGKSGMLFQILRSNEINARIALYGVTKNPRQFPNVPDHALTTEVVLTALHARPGNIGFVDLSDASKFSRAVREIFVKTAVTTDYRAISLVPEDFRSIPDIAWEALRQSPLAIRYIQTPTLDMAEEAIRRDPRAIGLMNLSAFADSDREALILSAMTQDVSLYRAVPAEFRSYNVSWAAVLKDGKLLGEVPENLRSKELCGVALSTGGDMSHVPEHLRTYLSPRENNGPLRQASSPAPTPDLAASAEMAPSKPQPPSKVASEGAMTTGMRDLARRLVATLPRRSGTVSPAQMIEPVLFVGKPQPASPHTLTFNSSDPQPEHKPMVQKSVEAAPVLSARL